LNNIDIGTFKINSGKSIITDPCYENNKSNCQLKGLPTQNGVWHSFVEKCEVGDWGNRVINLRCIHEEWLETEKTIREDKELLGNIGVDSGQAGVFDQMSYPEDPIKDGYFYEHISNVTIKKRAGTIDFGCVSSSGIGDGWYGVFGTKFNNMIIFFEIEYIDEESLRELCN